MDENEEFAIKEIKPTNTKERRKKDKKVKKTKIKYNKCLVCATFVLLVVVCLTGFVTIIPGVTFDHWKIKFDLNFESYSRLWILDGAGMFVGSLLCALVPCCCSHISLGVGAVLMSLFPCTISFFCLQVSSFVSGLGKGLIFVCGLKLLHLWPDSSTSLIIQLFFISYSIGGMLATQLSEHYLSTFISIQTTANTTLKDIFDVVSFNDSKMNTLTLSPRENIEVYFMQLIIFILCVISLIFMLFWSCFCYNTKQNDSVCSRFCKCKSNKKNENVESVLDYEDFRKIKKPIEVNFKREETWPEQQDLSNEGANDSNMNRRMSVKQWFATNTFFDATVFMFLYVHFFFAFGLESVLAKFLCHINTIFSTQKLQYAVDISSIYSIFTCMFVVGRFFSISFLHAYSSNAIIAVCLATNVVATAIISAYFEKSENLVLLCFAVFSAFLSPIFPAGFSRANTYLAKSLKSLGLAICCASIGYCCFSWISGFILSKSTPFYLMFFITATCCLCTLTYVPLLVKIKQKKNSQHIKSTNSFMTASKSIITYV